jgi:protoporphyrinogen oxidase
VTLPYVQLRQIAAGGGLEPRLQRINDDLDYQGVLNVLVMLRRSLTKHYWIPVVNCDVPFQGIVETTRAVDLEDSGGRHLAYLLNYVHRSDPLFQRDPEELQRKYVDALLGLVPGLTAADVTDAAVFRAPFVEPLYTPGYGKRVPPEELVPGRVYLATTAQIYPNVTSWNSSTGLAKRVAERLVSRAGVPA